MEFHKIGSWRLLVVVVASFDNHLDFFVGVVVVAERRDRRDLRGRGRRFQR
jgi:hypothetical protein